MTKDLKTSILKALQGTSFFRMPASSIHHLNKFGGLFEHSMNVVDNLEELTERLGLEWERPESPFVIGILHDACKIDAYFYNPDYKCWEKNPDCRKGHGELSVTIAEELGIELTEEEKMCISWHMGAFDDEENWNLFTSAVQQYPNVLWTHTADMISAHIDESNRYK